MTDIERALEELHTMTSLLHTQIAMIEALGEHMTSLEAELEAMRAYNGLL